MHIKIYIMEYFFRGKIKGKMRDIFFKEGGACWFNIHK